MTETIPVPLSPLDMLEQQVIRMENDVAACRRVFGIMKAPPLTGNGNTFPAKMQPVSTFAPTQSNLNPALAAARLAISQSQRRTHYSPVANKIEAYLRRCTTPQTLAQIVRGTKLGRGQVYSSLKTGDRFVGINGVYTLRTVLMTLPN